MRFPFFATNRTLKRNWRYEMNARINVESALANVVTEQADLRQQILVLEGRINKLEPNKHISKVVRKYTRKQWTRMTKERRASIILQLNPAEREYLRRHLEVQKHGRKKGK